MAGLYFLALAVIAVSLSALMAGAWVVQQRTGNSGWVDTVWTFSVGLIGAGSRGGSGIGGFLWLGFLREAPRAQQQQHGDDSEYGFHRLSKFG